MKKKHNQKAEEESSIPIAEDHSALLPDRGTEK